MRTRGPRTRREVDHQLVSTDLSAPEPVAPGPRPPKGWEQRRIDRENASAEASALLHQMVDHLGGLLTVARAVPPSDVLAETTAKIGANGQWTGSWGTAFAAVAIANTSPWTLVVQSSPPGSATPGIGAGIVRVPGGIHRVFPMRGADLTVYGPPTTAFDLAVFVRPRPPAAGPCGFASVPFCTSANTTTNTAALHLTVTPGPGRTVRVFGFAVTAPQALASADSAAFLGQLAPGRQLAFAVPASGLLVVPFDPPVLGVAPGTAVELAVDNVGAPFSASMWGDQC